MEKPKINKILRILFLIGGIFLLLLCLWSIRDGYFPTEAILKHHPSPSDNFYLFNKVLAGVSLLLGIFHLWLAKELGKPHGAKWLWITVLICIIPSAVSAAFIFGIPILIFWCSKKNRTYHFEPGNREVRETPAENLTE
jgi:hypothetical protein